MLLIPIKPVYYVISNLGDTLCSSSWRDIGTLKNLFPMSILQPNNATTINMLGMKKVTEESIETDTKPKNFNVKNLW